MQVTEKFSIAEDVPLGRPPLFCGLRVVVGRRSLGMDNWPARVRRGRHRETGEAWSAVAGVRRPFLALAIAGHLCLCDGDGDPGLRRT